MDHRCTLGCRGGDTEEHHVAFRANDPDLTVRLCRPHHRSAHRGLRVLGVDGRRGRARPPAEIAYARAAGLAVLLHLAVGPDPRITRALADLAGAVSRSLGCDVGPTPSETGLFEPPPPTGSADGLLGLLGALPGDDPVAAFERSCQGVLEALR